MTDSNATLLPCPFCGGEAKLDFDCGRFVVFCKNPDCSWRDTVEEAIEAWNTRAGQAVAATLGVRECEMELIDTSYHGFDVYRCSSCGTEVAELTYMGKSDKPNFCKNCGKAVKR